MRPWVTFDLDNTLVRNPYWRLHLRPWLEAEVGQEWKSLWGQFRLEGERRWRAGHWVSSFDWSDIACTLGVSALPSPSRPSASTVLPLVLPGAQSTLMAMKRLPVRLGLVTNGFLPYQRPYLEALGWDYLFDRIMTPDVALRAKPDGRIMEALSPGLAHIGDRLSHDVLVAQRTDRLGVLIGVPAQELDRIDPWSPTVVRPDYLVHTLSRLPSLIESLL